MKAGVTGLLGFGGASPTPLTIFSGILVDWFTVADLDSLTIIGGNAVQSWAGQRGVLTVSAIAAGQRPVYGVDGSEFAGLSVVQTASATGKFLTTGAMGGDIVAIASRPWMLAVARLSVAYTAGGGKRMVTLAHSGGTNTCTLKPGSANNTVACDGQGASQSGDVALDTNPHVIGGGYSASGEDMCAVDGTESTGGTAGGGAASNNTFNIGSFDHLGNLVDDINVSDVLLLTQKPSASQYTQFRAWALAQRDVP